MNLGMGEILLLLALALVLFGAKRLPEVGRAVGSAMREFKRGLETGESPEKNPSVLDIPSLYRFEGSLRGFPREFAVGLSIRTLKTAQEKKAKTERTGVGCMPHVLGGYMADGRDQAKKSAGWMPRH